MTAALGETERVATQGETQSKKSTRKHEFSTKSALLMTGLTLVLMAALSLVFSDVSLLSSRNDGEANDVSRWLVQDDDNNDKKDYSQYSCNDIYKHTPYPGESQCLFSRQCNDGAGLWISFPFCHNNKLLSTNLLVAMMSPIMLLWMVLLFRMLSSTAEDYFSPALEMFSVKLGLPPRFAGVSLLALGNGAADVSSTVSAITADPASGYQLSLGALTGAGMFISCLVSATVVVTADGVPCRGALVRDVTMLALTVLVVWQQLHSGSVGPDTVSLFLSFYGIFVVLVLVADIYHRAVVVPRLAVVARERERQRQLAEARRLQQETAAVDMAHPEELVESPVLRGPGSLAHFITALSNYDNPSGGGIESEDLDRPIVLHGSHGILRRHAETTTTQPTAPEAADEGAGGYSMLDGDVGACVEPGSFGFPASNWTGAFYDGREELLQHANSVWEDIAWDADISAISKFLLICELPFTTLRKLTIPIPCEGYYVRGLVALSLALSPLWFGYYMWNAFEYNILSNGGWLYFLIIWLLLCFAALCVQRYAPGGDGTMALAVSTPIALYGFVLAATWIDTIATALVSLLDFVGTFLRIPGPIIGLTILAWGNSMADLSANVTMARKGLGNMAMTACFAGPVFNILVGLGLGFGRLAAKTGSAETEVALPASVVTGLFFLLLNSVAILTTGLFFGKGRISKTYGYAAFSLYAIYVVVSIVSQYSHKEEE